MIEISWELPAVMREGAIRFRHAVCVFALLNGGAAIVGGVEKLTGQPVDHGVFVAPARRLDQPANGQCLSPLRSDFDGHLIGGAADTAGTNLDCGSDIVECLMEDRQGLLLGLRLNAVEGAIDDGLGYGLLAGIHQVVHELRDDEIAEFGIGIDFSFLGAVTA
jgi:hypothetical protein